MKNLPDLITREQSVAGIIFTPLSLASLICSGRIGTIEGGCSDRVLTVEVFGGGDAATTSMAVLH